MSLSKPEPFPMFKLPFVALKEVLKHFEIADLTRLTMTTRKVGSVMKFVTPRNHIHVDVKSEPVSELPCILVSYNNQNQGPDLAMHLDTLNSESSFLSDPYGGEIKVWCPVRTSNIHFYSPRVFLYEPFIELVKMILNVYNCPTVSVTNHRDCRQMLREIENLDVSIKDVKCGRRERESARDYISLMSACSNIRSLSICADTEEGFFYRPPSRHHYQLDYLNLVSCRWMELEDFVNCKVIELNIEGKAKDFIQPEQLNRFLKMWMEMDEHSRIEHLNVRLPQSEKHFEVVIRGLGNGNIDNLPNEEKGVEIRSVRGKRATIGYQGDRVHFRVLG